ncbi:DUF418 domain-containing protein [Nonomuraea sp. NPDC004297]
MGEWDPWLGLPVFSLLFRGRVRATAGARREPRPLAAAGPAAPAHGAARDGLPIGHSLTAAYWTAGAILAAQWLFCTLWSRYRQGPAEWLWRWATWAHRPPLRLPAP